MLRIDVKLTAATMLISALAASAAAGSALAVTKASAPATGGATAGPTQRSGRTCRTTIVKVGRRRVHRRICTRATSAADPEVFITTSTLSRALSHVADLQFSSRPTGGPLIAVNDAIRYQRIGGFGAAMTDASAWLIHDQLSPSDSSAVMRALFGQGGIRLSFVRVPIGASDFTAGGLPYSYDEIPSGQTDPALAQFSIAHDGEYILPLLRQAQALNPQLQLLASPWTAPSWMKANDALNDLGGSGALLTDDYAAFAQYLVRFIQSYAAAGVQVSALTPENEPSTGSRSIAYPGMTLGVSAEADLIADDIAPALRAAGLQTKIYGADQSWSSVLWGSALMSGPAGPSLAGMAWHCYFGLPSNMTLFHQLFPSVDQIVDECSPEIRPLFTAEFLIASLRNWASTVALWNLALDPDGGPVQPPNTGCQRCNGVITISEQNHTARLDKKFFQLGQVSKFVAPGAVRVDSPSFVTYTATARGFASASPGLDDVAFVNPDGSKVLVAYNNTPATAAFSVQTRGRYFGYRLPGWAMATFVWDRPR